MKQTVLAPCAYLVLAAVILLSTSAGVAQAAVMIAPSPRQPVFSELRIGALQEPDSLNPHLGVLSASYVIWAHVYELLVGIGVDLSSPAQTAVPALAQTWEVSADNLSWTFHLVRNATWHDGVPFTAEDVNFTFRYIAPADAYNPIGCDLAQLQPYLGAVDVGNITVLDPYTIRVPTVQPKANILSMFIQILPKHVWEQIPCNRATNVKNDRPVGTGMYNLTNWQRGAYIQLDLNTNYWRLDPTQDYVDRITIIYYASDQLLYNAFLAGDVHATDALTAAQFIQMPLRVAGSGVDNVRKYQVPSIGMSEIGMCVASDQLISDWGKPGGRHWLLTNLTVRQALQHAVNRSFLVENVIEGLGGPGETMIPPATPFWHYDVPSAEEYSFDLDRARGLLNDPKGDGYTLRAGATVPGDFGQNLNPTAANNQDAFIDTNGDNVRDVVNPSQVVAGDRWGTSAPNGNDLSFTLSVINYDTAGQDAADFEIQWWAQVGIRVVKDVVTEPRMINITYACSVDLYDWGWGGDVDPDFLLSVMTTGQILYWQDAWYSNATYDQLYLTQQTQVDPIQRQQTIHEMQRILYRDAPYIINWYPDSLAVVRTDLYTGWGDWNLYQGLGLTGYGNDFIMLSLRSTAGVITNQCPTTPIIEGTSPRSVYAGVNLTFAGNATDPENDALTWFWSWDDGNSTQLSTASGVTQTIEDYGWPAPGTYNVTLTADDTQCGSLKTSAPFRVNVLAVPVQYGWINGTVRDAATLAPIPGASVDVSPGGFGDAANATGRYSVQVAAGTYSAVASQALYGPESRTGIVVTAFATNTVDFDLGVLRGWIAGTVTSSAGGPIENATVRATSGAREFVDRTDAQGQYNITATPATSVVEASHSAYVSGSRTGIVVTDGQTTPVNFVLTPLAQPGLDPLLVGAIAAIVIIGIGAVAYLVFRRRRKAEEIAPPMPPSPPPP